MRSLAATTSDSKNTKISSRQRENDLATHLLNVPELYSKIMARQIVRKILELVIKAQELARSIGISNLLQPGLVKEMIIADLLRHDLITSKRDADVYDPNDPSIKYEYFSYKEGGSGQLDRMFKEPPDKRAESLVRITRNAEVYFAVFHKKN